MPEVAALLSGVHLLRQQFWLSGTMHFAVAEHQLPYYLDDYTFRFNRRTALYSLLDPESNPYFS